MNTMQAAHCWRHSPLYSCVTTKNIVSKQILYTVSSKLKWFSKQANNISTDKLDEIKHLYFFLHFFFNQLLLQVAAW